MGVAEAMLVMETMTGGRMMIRPITLAGRDSYRAAIKNLINKGNKVLPDGKNSSLVSVSSEACGVAVKRSA